MSLKISVNNRNVDTDVIDVILIGVQEVIIASAESVKGIIVASANSVMT